MEKEKKKQIPPQLVRTTTVFAQDGLDTSKAKRLLQEMAKQEAQQNKGNKK
ncbi:TPA: hypothetical protein ACSEXO_003690 [Proteus mirabilis]|uniref:hypothetical protein n=1 Tax=Proteus mirabilis TaxID=584 RepID=UPI0018C58A41|nr:hypothetical protein [Proteus mirabilis]MBG2742021.1 hypothetical protein [Proteus mirabilis]MDF7208518.1 hypothetical protein [Proteus mirabilis]HCT9440448.1 hypothetical protein [Proteus mirabilis]